MIVEASVALWTGRLTKAEDLTKAAMDVLAPGDDLWFCRAANICATVLYSTGRRDAASELLHEALDRGRGPGTAHIFAELHLTHGVLHLLSLDYDRAIQILTDGHAFAAEHGFNSIQILLESNIARFHVRKEDFAAAELWVKRAEARLAQNSVPVMAAYLEEVRGEVFLGTGQVHRAIEALEAGLENAAKLDDKRAGCQILAVLGRAWEAAGMSRRALEVLQQGQAIADEISYPLWQRRFRLAIATSYEKMGNFQEALDAFKDYMDIDRALFDLETEKRLVEMRTRYELAEAQKLAKAERARSEELDKARAKAEILAWTDTLTGLRNRHALLTDLPAQLGLAGDDGLILMMLDLDRFKQVNDTYGHDAGDAVLVAVADRIRAVLGDDGIGYRLGGDEFAVILNPGVVLDRARIVADALIDAIVEPVQFDGRGLYVGTSIGLAASPENATTPAELLRVADVALYEAKAAGRGQYRQYEREVDLRARKERMLENDLRQALERGEMRLLLQPLVDGRSQKIIGAEGLLRWQHPRLGLLEPVDFLDILDRGDMVFEIGDWVLQTGWQMLHDLDDRFPEMALNLSLNVSARQFFDSDFVETLRDFQFQSPALVHRLELEITEGTMVGNIDQAVTRMHEAGMLGYRLSIDDFGTGYSSIAQLATLPVHSLKIDQVFVEELQTSEPSSTIIRSMVNLGENLGLTVTAEGVETPTQAEVLMGYGCHRLQGYLFGLPMAWEDFLLHLVNWDQSAMGA